MYGVSSTRFGSTRRRRSCDGDFSVIRQETIAFRQKLLPLPVAPATSKCGIFERSKTTSSPPLALPSAIGRCALLLIFWYSRLSITLRSVTRLGVGLGTSIPTRDLPIAGVSMRIAGVFSASARSFSRASIVSTLTRVFSSTRLVICLPDSSRTGLPSLSTCLWIFCRRTHPGTRPYIVTVGPGRTWPISTSTPYSPRVLVIASAVSRSSSCEMGFSGAVLKTSGLGICHVPTEPFAIAGAPST